MTINLIECNPLLKKPLLTVLTQCQQNQEVDRIALEQAAREVWDDAYPQSPAVSVDILIRHGALEEHVLLNGEPYAGTPEDLQLDAHVPDDAVASAQLSITDLGRELLETYAPEATLAALLAEKPQYRDVFYAILRACCTNEGCTREDLEHIINELPPLQPDPETKRAQVYPQYFIDALESAGGITWHSSWHITEAGRAALVA